MPEPASSFDVLRAYLTTRGTFSEEDFALVRAAMIPARLARGRFLQRAGEPAKYGVFVASGCLRTYVIDRKGKEHILQFAPETWWLADVTSLANGTPSQFFIDAIEDSDVLLLDPPSHQNLLERVPGYAASFRTGMQRHAAAKDLRIVAALSASAEERYLEFLQTYPSIVNRVPQFMLASYLGLTPETLSRIRRNRARP